MTETGVSFTAARWICFLLISPQFPTVTQQKGQGRKGRKRGGGDILALEPISRSAIIKKRTEREEM